MRNINCIALSGTDTGSHSGVQIDSNQLILASFQAVFGDVTVAGTFKLQMSNDICNDRYQAGSFTVTNWTDIPNASASITSGGSAVLSLSNFSYRWIRAVFTYTSGGSSTVTVTMNAVGV